MRGEASTAPPVEGVLNPGNCTTDYDVVVEL